MTTNELLNANGNTQTLDWYGADGTLFASGGFGGGTVSMAISCDGGLTWFNAKNSDGVDLALTAAGAFNFSMGNCKVRGVLSGATGPAVTISIQER